MEHRGHLAISEMRHFRIESRFGKMLIASEPLKQKEKSIPVKGGFCGSVSVNGKTPIMPRTKIQTSTQASNVKQRVIPIINSTNFASEADHFNFSVTIYAPKKIWNFFHHNLIKPLNTLIKQRDELQIALL